MQSLRWPFKYSVFQLTAVPQLPLVGFLNIKVSLCQLPYYMNEFVHVECAEVQSGSPWRISRFKPIKQFAYS